MVHQSPHRKVTLWLPVDLWNKLERHVAAHRTTKNATLFRMVLPHLLKLPDHSRPEDENAV